jgi:hypothetical protein
MSFAGYGRALNALMANSPYELLSYTFFRCVKFTTARKIARKPPVLWPAAWLLSAPVGKTFGALRGTRRREQGLLVQPARQACHAYRCHNAVYSRDEIDLAVQ